MHDALIIGAGQAGLAAAYYLKESGQDLLLLEGNARVGDNWRKRWEGLQLFTPQRYNGLPGKKPEGKDWSLINREEAADYLEAYATELRFPIQNNCTCVRAKKGSDGNWTVATTAGEFTAKRLVVATGAYKDAWLPQDLSTRFPAGIQQVHSSAIKRVSDLADSNTAVLMIGAGASGQQLSRLFVAAGAEVTLTGSEVSNLPRKFLGKDIYWWLYNSGMMSFSTTRFPGKQMTQKKQGVVTVGEPATAAEIKRIPKRITDYRAEKLVFNCNNTPDYAWPPAGKKALIVWCTGYQNHYPFLPGQLLDGAGQPLHQGGISTADASVAYVGLENLRRPSSSLLGGVGRDAREIVAELLQKSA